MEMTDPETLFGRPFKAELVPVERGTRPWRIYIRRAHAYAGHPLNLYVKM